MHLSFGRSVGLFLCQARDVKGCIARLLDLCSEIWLLLKGCTSPYLSEGAKEVGLNSQWACTSLFHVPGLWLLWKEMRRGQVSALSPCLAVSYQHRPFFSGTQEVSSVFVWEGMSFCLHHSLHSFLGSPSPGVQ